MLPARSRVRRPPEFTAVTRGGRRCGSRSLVVHLLLADPSGAPAPPEAPAARAGFVVGRTVGPAVVRNRVRRRLRHLVADRLAELPRGSMLVVRALPASAGRSWDELGADLDRSLSRCRAGR